MSISLTEPTWVASPWPIRVWVFWVQQHISLALNCRLLKVEEEIIATTTTTTATIKKDRCFYRAWTDDLASSAVCLLVIFSSVRVSSILPDSMYGFQGYYALQVLQANDAKAGMSCK